MSIERRYIGIGELSEYTGICVNTLRYWLYLRRIPYFKVGKLIKFDRIEIDAWLNEKKVKEIT